MARLLTWGVGLDGVSGEMPATEAVSSLAALRSALDEHTGALVLAEPRCLEAERAALERWLLHEGGAAQALIVAVVEPGEADAVLARLPFLDDAVVRPLSAGRLRHKLLRGAESLHGRRVVGQLDEALRRKREEVSDLNRIGLALSAEHDIDALLRLILEKSREITSADAGSLYLVERATEGDGRDRLRFKLTQNDSVEWPFEEFTIPLDQSSIAGYAALSGRVVNVGDAHRLPEGSPFQISRSFDQRSGYRTRSMLVVPMRDHQEVVIGVVQLINKKRDRSATLAPVSLVEEQVVPFAPVDEELVSSLASQAAVAIENADLIQRIRRLFDEFILGAVAAVEMRDPVTEGHSRRVAVLTVGLARRVNQAGSRLAHARLDTNQLEELRYAALLHDFGKVAVEENYLKKEKKLYASKLITLRQRFAYVGKALEATYLRRRLEAVARGGTAPDELRAMEAEFERRREEIRRILQAVVSANEPTVVEDESFRAILDLPVRSFADHGEEDHFPVEAWAEGPLLSSDEKEALTIRKGSLTRQEREEINKHVSHTYEFLKKIPWTGEFRSIPEIAWAHHEKLDGSGYPRGLRSAEIRPQSRMMTIADIYDALTAAD
ncbi:MAG TPA: HD domain-containing phosphohydrolase, partial [Vicinamibacteria bacterium]|nr:HD domain-containing phosphohydrolase [Vicinamibacteria bacterium]